MALHGFGVGECEEDYCGLAVMARKTLSSTGTEWVKMVAAFAPGIAT